MHNYQQLIKSPTRITDESSTLIDVVLTNTSRNISTVISAPMSLSDHDLIGCVRKLNNKRINPRTIKCRNYSKYDPKNLKKDLNEEIFYPLYNINDVNTACSFLHNILATQFEKHFFFFFFFFY